MSQVKVVLDGFFNTVAQLDEQEQRKIWFILTALRGPDIENPSLKYVTTARIRAMACPRLAAGCGAYVAPGPVENRMKGGYHFATHVEMAAVTLQRAGYTPATEDELQTRGIEPDPSTSGRGWWRPEGTIGWAWYRPSPGDLR